MYSEAESNCQSSLMVQTLRPPDTAITPAERLGIISEVLQCEVNDLADHSFDLRRAFLLSREHQPREPNRLPDLVINHPRPNQRA